MAFAALRTHADPDLWGHLRFGQDILRDHRLVSVDPYSFTQDLPWTNHEWLSETVTALAYTAGGDAGLWLYKAFIVGIALGLVWQSLRAAHAGWRWSGLVIAAVAAHALTLTIRPQLWTLLFVVVLCRLLVAGGRALWFIPVMAMAWANLHGGWVLGLGILSVWTFGCLIDVERRGDAVTLIPVVVVSVLATLVNPYGPHLWEFIASTVRLSRDDISEWQPIWRHSVGAMATWISVVLYVAWAWRRQGRPSPATWLVLFMLAFSSLRVMRLVALFAPAAVVLLAPRLPKARRALVTPLGQTVVDVVMVAVVLLLSFQMRIVRPCVSIEGASAPDLDALAALAESKPTGRMITAFDWGQAALATVGPAVKVSIDGRRETVYSARTRQAQYQIQFGDEEGFRAIDRLSPDYVWLPLPDAAATRTWLISQGYRIDIQTSRSFVASSASAKAITPASSVKTSSCFPGVPPVTD